MPSQQISGQDASSACRRPPSAGRRGKVPEPGHKPQDPEGKTSSSSPAKVVQTQQRMTIRQQQQIEAMLEPEPRLREGLPPPAPPALQRATVDGKRDAKTRHTQGPAGQQNANHKEHRRNVEPPAEVANRIRPSASPAPLIAAAQTDPAGVLAQLPRQSPRRTRIVGAVQATSPAVRTRLARLARSNILVDPGQEPPDMTVRDGVHRTGGNATGFVKH